MKGIDAKDIRSKALEEWTKGKRELRMALGP